jgi:hypothetical protein
VHRWTHRFNLGPLAAIVMLALLVGYWMRPDAVHAATGDAMALWWASTVPIVFPGYLAGSYVVDNLSDPRPALVVLGLATWPAIGGAWVLSAVRAGRLDADQAEYLWRWANFSNPLLAPTPMVAAAVALAGLAVALPGRAALNPSPLPGALTGPRLAARALTAMNWATVFGAGIVLVAWAEALTHGPALGLLFWEPVSQPHAAAPLVAWALAQNGLVFLLPQLGTVARMGLPVWRWAAWRILAGGLAAAFTLLLSLAH